MNDIAIRVENLSKLYHIGPRERYGALRDTLTDAMYTPFHAVASVLNGRRSAVSGQPSNNCIWALKDVSFEVRRGEVVGIIGGNGAGKSTLLKILSRITEPTEGCAKIHGRVGSLLEVGTGFHPELTGRENIYLNGAILGMKKAEIDHKFDEIVDFSGVERFIDTPVKRYSSGMQMRLAFSVAAHLEPEILLVDEVLAVGDVAFQKKCLGKMQSVTKEGRTVLFVSHTMAAIRNLCERTLLIDSGRIIVDGRTDQAIARYLDRNLHEGAVVTREQLEVSMEGSIRRDRPAIRFKEIALLDEQGFPRNEFQSDEEIRVSVTYECLILVTDLRVTVMVVDEENRPIITTQNVDDTNTRYTQRPGVYRSLCIIPPNIFGEKIFYISVHLEYTKIEHLILNKVLSFRVEFKGYNNMHGSHHSSFLRPRLSWETQLLDGGEWSIYG